jgi:hypothetical protein
VASGSGGRRVTVGASHEEFPRNLCGTAAFCLVARACHSRHARELGVGRGSDGVSVAVRGRTASASAPGHPRKARVGRSDEVSAVTVRVDGSSSLWQTIPRVEACAVGVEVRHCLVHHAVEHGVETCQRTRARRAVSTRAIVAASFTARAAAAAVAAESVEVGIAVTAESERKFAHHGEFPEEGSGSGNCLRCKLCHY